MATFLVVLIAILVPACVVCFGVKGTQRPKRDRAETPADIWNSVQPADRFVQAAYRDARRAMNIAAGQSWRNLAD